MNECREDQVNGATAARNCLLYSGIRGQADMQCSLLGYKGQKALLQFISSGSQQLLVISNSFYHWALECSKQLYQMSKSFMCCHFYTRMSLSSKPYGIFRCWRKPSSIVHECKIFSIVISLLNEPRLDYTTSQLILHSSFVTTHKTWKLFVSIQLL